MTSIPQLRKDIARLQEENAELKSKLAEKQEVKEVIVYRDIEKVVYRDNPAHIAMIKKLRGK